MTKMKGFTLIELLFVLQIILVFSFLHLPYFSHSNEQREVVLQEIIICIENVRLDAIIQQQSVGLSFFNHSISTDSTQIFHSQDLTFYNSKIIYFNKEGHISKACTINFKLKKHEYKLVFNLGQGAFYIDEI